MTSRRERGSREADSEVLREETRSRRADLEGPHRGDRRPARGRAMTSRGSEDRARRTPKVSSMRSTVLRGETRSQRADLEGPHRRDRGPAGGRPVPSRGSENRWRRTPKGVVDAINVPAGRAHDRREDPDGRAPGPYSLVLTTPWCTRCLRYPRPRTCGQSRRAASVRGFTIDATSRRELDRNRRDGRRDGVDHAATSLIWTSKPRSRRRRTKR